MRPIKVLLALFFIGILSNGLNAQSPAPRGYPITNSNGWIRYGFLQNDSGRIDAPRDTNWTPRFIPTTVYWQHAGVDSAFWTFTKTTGQRWVKQGTGGSSSQTSTQDFSTENYLSYSIPFYETSFTDSTLVSQLQGGTTSYYFSKGLWLNGNYTGSIDNSRLIAYNYGYLVNQQHSQKLVFQVGDSSSNLLIGIGIKGSQVLASSINQTNYINATMGDSSISTMVNICNTSSVIKSSGILINKGDYIELQINQIADSVEFFYRNLTNNNSYRLVRHISFSISPVYNSVCGYPTIYFAKGNVKLISYSVYKNSYQYYVIGNSQTEGHRADYDSGFVRILQNYTSSPINNMAKAAATSTDYLYTIKDNYNFHNSTLFVSGLCGNDDYAGISAATSKANYIAIVNQLRAKGNRIVHIDNPYRASTLGAGGWAALQALNNWIDTTYGGIDTIIHVQTQTQANYPAWYADGAHLNNTGNLGIANIVLASGAFQLFNLQPAKTVYWEASSGDVKNINSSSVLVNTTTNNSAALSVFNASIPAYFASDNNGTGTVRISNVNTGANAAGGLRFYNSAGIGAQILTGSPSYSFGANALILHGVAGDATLASNIGNINFTIGSAFQSAARLRINPSGNIGVGANINADSLLQVIGGGLYTNRGVRHENLPSGASTDSVVTVDGSGTLKKRDASTLGTNLYNTSSIQTSDTRLYKLGRQIAGGSARTLNFGEYSTDRVSFGIRGFKTSGFGDILITAIDSVSNRSILNNFSPNGIIGNYFNYSNNTTLRSSSISQYIDSVVTSFNGIAKLRYNLGGDTLSIKGNLGQSASSTDSIFVRDTNGLVKMRAQSDVIPDQHLVTHRGVRITSNAAGDSIWIDDYVRVATSASASTITPNVDTTNMYTVTALATNPTFAAPTGTPYDGQPLMIRIKDNGTSRTLTWDAIYRASTDFALPTATTISKTMYVQFVYNAADTKWDAVGLTQNF